MPKVSILIPAYNDRYFEESLLSALHQNYMDIEVIVSDDSPHEKISNVVMKYKEEYGIRYFKNNPAQGPMLNYIFCLQQAKGEYIKFLNDDDLLDSECISKMVQVLDNNEHISLVTSIRQCINEKGENIKGHISTLPLFDKNAEMRSKEIYASMLHLRLNFIGEPTTAMFRRLDALKIKPHFMCFEGKPSYGAGDMAIWLNLLQMGNLYYIADTLSQFRLHGEQRQKSKFVRLNSNATWKWFKEASQNKGLLSNGFGWYILCLPEGSSSWIKIRVVNTKLIVRQFLIYIHSLLFRVRP